MESAVGIIEPSKRVEASIGAARQRGYHIAVVINPPSGQRDDWTSMKIEAAAVRKGAWPRSTAVVVGRFWFSAVGLYLPMLRRTFPERIDLVTTGIDLK
jgi:hypothetical protein